MMGRIVFILFIKQLFRPLVGLWCLHKQKLSQASAAAFPPYRYPADCDLTHMRAHTPTAAPGTQHGSAGVRARQCLQTARYLMHHRMLQIHAAHTPLSMTDTLTLPRTFTHDSVCSLASNELPRPSLTHSSESENMVNLGVLSLLRSEVQSAAVFYPLPCHCFCLF